MGSIQLTDAIKRGMNYKVSFRLNQAFQHLKWMIYADGRPLVWNAATLVSAPSYEAGEHSSYGVCKLPDGATCTLEGISAIGAKLHKAKPMDVREEEVRLRYFAPPIPPQPTYVPPPPPPEVTRRYDPGKVDYRLVTMDELRRREPKYNVRVHVETQDRPEWE